MTAERWLCSVCGHEALSRSGIYAHRATEPLCTNAEPVAHRLLPVTSLEARVAELERAIKAMVGNEQLLLQCVDAITELIANDSA